MNTVRIYQRARRVGRSYELSLARANGWGSAGSAPVVRQCPATVPAKTPAAQQLVNRVADAGGRERAPACGNSASGLRAVVGEGVA